MRRQGIRHAMCAPRTVPDQRIVQLAAALDKLQVQAPACHLGGDA